MIHFSDRQWENVRESYRKWWNGTLGRPILPMLLAGADPGRSKPGVPLLSFSNCTNLDITPEQIVDRYDYELSCYEYHGDSFPIMQMMCFGPGVAAVFLGAEPRSSENTVWFCPKKRVPVQELHFTYDGDNVWLRRIKDIYRAGMKKWGGSVCMSMVDLGGVMDILASHLNTEMLLFALYDEPEEVKRLVQEIQSLWLRFYDEIIEIIGGQQGFTDWSTIYSEKPSYMLQSGFSYMIGNEMFEEFIKDELAGTAGHLYRPFYHMDGVGQLKHLDSLLSIDAISGIQWVPGEGEPLKQDWSQVYRKISEAGKKIQAYYNFEFHLDEILAVVKRPDDLVKMQFGYPISEKREALRKLGRFI